MPLLQLQSPHILSVSTPFKSPKVKVSYETEGHLLTATSCKIKKQILCCQHAAAHNIRHHSRRRERAGVRKYWPKARLKHSCANPRSRGSMSCDKGLRWLSPSSCVGCTHFSLGLAPLSVYSSSWHVSPSSHISRFSESSTQARLHLYSGSQWPLPWSDVQGQPCHTSLAFLKHNPLLVSFLTLKPEPKGQHSQVLLPLGMEPSLLESPLQQLFFAVILFF